MLELEILGNQPSPVKLIPMCEEGVAELNTIDYNEYKSPQSSPSKHFIFLNNEGI